jgi:hypothetical protein
MMPLTLRKYGNQDVRSSGSPDLHILIQSLRPARAGTRAGRAAKGSALGALSEWLPPSFLRASRSVIPLMKRYQSSNQILASVLLGPSVNALRVLANRQN